MPIPSFFTLSSEHEVAGGRIIGRGGPAVAASTVLCGALGFPCHWRVRAGPQHTRPLAPGRPPMSCGWSREIRIYMKVHNISIYFFDQDGINEKGVINLKFMVFAIYTLF